MSKQFIIGCDPGLTGAIVVLDKEDGKLCYTYDMPVMPWSADVKKKSPDPRQLAAIFAGFPGSTIFIERVNAMPNPQNGRGMGATSAFQFGMGFGFLYAVACCYSDDVRLVVPTVWKRYHNLLKTEKDAARILAIDLFPTASLARKKDSGRADALLIADYGLSLIKTAQQKEIL